ncbi:MULTISPECIES: phosphonate metabolism protein/1,5-bisphosphokinase (PRPP-forming) PhnN [Phenylobacterium]|uniref:Ribose 1,5-bisphosphate phosphokinase PhnN n=1 Tax=Phenylobacterium koreense TaxID=266125 RepID=A0ABV2EG14_9CAUL
MSSLATFRQAAGKQPRGGRLVLVVGPSGVGKDTLLHGARSALREDPSVVFVRREITRPREAGGEDHAPLRLEAFEEREAAGAYLLSWRAHGLAYGIPRASAASLASGGTVVVNVSRAVLDEARRLGVDELRIVSVTADPRLLAERLAARGRETAAEIEQRLARAQAVAVEGEDVIVIANDGPPEAGVARLVQAIRG